MTTNRRLLLRGLVWAAVAAGLGLVVLAWQDPALTVDLANWVRACF
jgi:hypothetical protein